MSAGAPFRYCGRDFSAAVIDWVRALIAQRPALHRDGLIVLPPPRSRPRTMRPPPPSPATEPPLFPPPTRLGEVRPVRVEPVADAAEGRCWNAFVERHH